MKAEEIAKFAEIKYIERLNDFKTNDFKDGVFEGYNLALTQKQNDINELVEFIKHVEYLTSNEMLYSKSIELIQKHTKKQTT